MIGQVPHHGSNEERTEVVAEENGEPQNPSHHPRPFPVRHNPGGTLTEEIDGTGTLEESHQDADAQLDGAQPDEVLFSQGAGDKPGKALEALPHQENPYEAGQEEADQGIPENERQHDRQQSRDEGCPGGFHSRCYDLSTTI